MDAHSSLQKKAGKAVLSYTQEIQHTKKIGPKGLFQPSSVAKAIYDGVYEAATTNPITKEIQITMKDIVGRQSNFPDV